MENNVITTRTQKLYIHQDGFVYNKLLPAAVITLAEAKEGTRAMSQLTKGRKMPILVDSCDIKEMTQEARQYLAGQGGAKVANAVAMLIDSPVSKIIANFYINFNKPLIPTRLFTDKEEAIAWLKGYLNP